LIQRSLNESDIGSRLEYVPGLIQRSLNESDLFTVLITVARKGLSLSRDSNDVLLRRSFASFFERGFSFFGVINTILLADYTRGLEHVP